MPLEGLKGRKALVTGAASGIGAAIAARLRKEGVEVVSTDEDRARGLMHRKAIGANDGMLFIFDEPAYHSMWMKNTLIPLSVAFIDRDGTILNILDMEPETLDPHVSAGPSIYAIETNKGWFARKKVKAGDKVTGLPKK